MSKITNNLHNLLYNIKNLDTKIISKLKINFLLVMKQTQFSDYDVISLSKNNSTKMYFITRGIITENNKKNKKLESYNIFNELFDDIFLNNYEILNNGNLSKVYISYTDTNIKSDIKVYNLELLNQESIDSKSELRQTSKRNRVKKYFGGLICDVYDSAYTKLNSKSANEKKEVLSAALASKLAYLNLEPRYTFDGVDIKLNKLSPGYLNYTTLPYYNIQHNDTHSNNICLFINNDKRTKIQTSTTQLNQLQQRISTNDERYKKYRNYEKLSKDTPFNYFYKNDPTNLNPLPTDNNNKNHVVVISKWKHNDTNINNLDVSNIANIRTNFLKIDGQLPPGPYPEEIINEVDNPMELEDNALNIGMVRYYLLFDMNIRKFILSIRGTDFGGESNLANWFINTQFALRSLRLFYREHRGTTQAEADSAMECCYNFVFNLINDALDEIHKTIPSINDIADWGIGRNFGIPIKELIRNIILNFLKPQIKQLIKNLIEIELPITQPTPQLNKELLRENIRQFIDRFLTDIYESPVISIPVPIYGNIDITLIYIIRKVKSDIPDTCNESINHPQTISIINILKRFIESDYLGNTIEFSNNVFAQCRQIIIGLGFENDDLIISGHSLGGGLTQIISALNNVKGYGFNPVGTRIAISNLQSNGTTNIQLNLPPTQNPYLPYLALNFCKAAGIIVDTFRLTFNNFNLVANDGLHFNNTENYIVNQDLIHKIKLTSNYIQIHNGSLYELSVPEYKDCYKESFYMDCTNLGEQFKKNVTSFHGIDGLLLMLSKIMHGQNITLDDFNIDFITLNKNTNNCTTYFNEPDIYFGGNDKYYKKYLKYKSKYLELLDKSKNI
jgi:hypothetical protein